MTTVAEVLASLKKPEQPKRDRVANWYSKRIWRAARYKFLLTQPRPLRCRCCGATAEHNRLVVDHITPIKKDWSRRLDQSNFQILCNDCNLAKASSDQTNWSATQTGANK